MISPEKIAEARERIRRAKESICWKGALGQPASAWKNLTIAESILGQAEDPERCPVHGTILVNPPPVVVVSGVTGRREHRPAEKPFCVACEEAEAAREKAAESIW